MLSMRLHLLGSTPCNWFWSNTNFWLLLTVRLSFLWLGLWLKAWIIMLKLILRFRLNYRPSHTISFRYRQLWGSLHRLSGFDGFVKRNMDSLYFPLVLRLDRQTLTTLLWVLKIVLKRVIKVRLFLCDNDWSIFH